LTDKEGRKPFDYLTCSTTEKKQTIEKILESVNFFFGRYFGAPDVEKVTNSLLTANENLLKYFQENSAIPKQDAMQPQKTLTL